MEIVEHDVLDATTGANQPKSIKPVATDAWDSLSIDEQTWLNDIADQVRLELSQKGGTAAIKLLEEQGLSPEHKVAIWSRFDSKERSAMKKKEAA